MSTRILVVDDATLFRRAVSEALAGIPGVEVAGTASNGRLALSRLAALSPDLMTLDLEMPEMGGLEVLEAMQAAGEKTGVIVLSSHTRRGGSMTVRALELGAFDFVTKPEARSPEESLLLLRQALQPRVRAFLRRREIQTLLGKGSAAVAVDRGPEKPRQTPLRETPLRRTALRPTPLRPVEPIVLIGVSTGGPAALAEVLPALPGNLRAPVFIVQHMPPLFTKALAERLDTKSSIQVKEAEHGEVAVKGWAYLAPGGRQMKLAPGPAGEIVIQITDDPPEKACRPSVDYLFRSAALHFPGRAVAAILTGMGNDGAQGLEMLKRSGASTIAQDEGSCVVFGMPREAIMTGAVDVVVPLTQVARAILRAIEGAAD